MADDPPEELATTPKVGDTYINTELMLPRGSTRPKGRVTGRKRDAGGQVCGQANNNPILDTRTYLVQFGDGEVTELMVNVIDAQMYAQYDPDGNRYVILDDLTDHRKSSKALSIEYQKATDSCGRNTMRGSTAGWNFFYQWKDGSTSLEKLCNLKESHPVEMAEYAHQRGISHKPAFNYWAQHVLKKRDAIIYLVNNSKPQYLKRTHKFGVNFLKSVADAHDIDKKNGNTFWADNIAK